MMTWRELLADARNTAISDEIVHLAGKWATCAVGEQSRLHPEVVTLERFDTMDPVLHDRGSYFYAALLRKDIKNAEEYLDRIEDRVLELKRKL